MPATNILHNFYHFSSDDLEELNKLLVLIRANKILQFVEHYVKIENYKQCQTKERQQVIAAS